MDAQPLARRLAAVVLTLPFLIGACTSAAAPATDGALRDSTSPPAATVTSPPASAPGDDPVNGSDPPGGPIDPGAPFVEPRPGQLDVRPIAMDALEATVDGSTITVIATWTSGVEPCSVLDSIVVERSANTYTITLREGRGPEEIACIAIAVQKQTRFEIRDVAAGTWSIQDAQGGAPSIEVAIG
jgi:hypothetical protein